MMQTISKALRSLSLFALAAAATAAGAQQSLVQVPYASVVLGVPATTYNGTNGQACTSTTPGYLDSVGDGCPATQAVLNYPYGLAIDGNNNLYVGEYTNDFVRVIYQGGANLAAALIAGNPKYTFTPTPGDVYPFGGATASLTKTSGVYFCTGTSGATALDSQGNGCPVQYAYIKPRGLALDHDGNIFVASIAGYQGVRIIYVGGTAAARLITTYNPTITAPQPGYVYSLSASGDFVAIRDLAIDSNENVYAVDNGAQAAATNLQAATSGNQVKHFSGTGWTTYILGTSANAAGAAGDGGAATSASVSFPVGILADASNNLYITDQTNNRIRVVYNAGSTPPLYVQGANTTVVTAPTPGFIYTVAGGGAVHTTGNLASTLSLGSLNDIGLDASGNLLFTDSAHYLWREDARTGNAVVLGGSGVTATTYSASAAPAAGAACNGATGGPVMTDAYADGCPATEVEAYTSYGRIVFDTAGNFYEAEQRVTAQNDGIVRKYTFTNQFGTAPVGTTTAAISLAYTPTSAATYTPTGTYVLTGDPTTEFADAGNDTCSTTGVALTETCVFNATFKPALAGARLGALVVTAAGANLISTPLGGTGIGPQLTLDPATRTTVGTGLAPSGTAVDQGGNAYVADAPTGNIFRSVAGAAPTVFATGFKNPAQLALDGPGNLYVADSGNNRIAVVTPAGTVSTLQTPVLSAPAGVAADASGTIYIADTGNNRVLAVAPLGGVSTRAFTGLSSPHGLSVDSAGNLFVSDTGNSRIAELSATGVQSAVTITPALISPVAVAVDPAGDLYIADTGNLNVVELPAGATAATALVGNTAGLTGLAVDTTGDVFVAGSTLGGLLELNRTSIAYTFADTNVGQTTSQVLSLSNTGNATLTLGATLTTGTDTTDFAVAAATTNGCSPAQAVTPGQGCSLLATFQPRTKGQLKDTLTFPANQVNSPIAQLIGNGVQKVGTTTALTYSTTTGGQPLAGQPFTVTATVTPATNAGAVGGSVAFSVDGGTAISAPVTNGVATTPLTLGAGAHTITAIYSGDSNYVASSASLSVTAVNPAATTTALTVTSTGTPSNGTAFTLTATTTSTASQGNIAGTVTFTINGTTQTLAVTNGTVSATFTLPTGKYTATATFSGDPYYLTSTGSLAVQVIPAGTSSVKLAVTSPAGAIAFGQPVVVNAAITTGNATATPTGTVTFTVDGGSAQTLPYAASVSATFTGLSAGAHTFAATYSGDNSYAPGTGTLAITIGKATPATALTITPNVAASGNTLTLTASVTSTITTPTGTVIFSAGGTVLGTGTLVNGTATFTTKTNVQASYAFTAAYSGDTNFLPATFGLTPKPDFVASLTLPTVTEPQYGVALDYLTLNSFYGYTGNVQISCSGLPANSVCTPTPTASTVTADGVQTVQVQVYLDVNPNPASSLAAPLGLGRKLAAGIAVCLLLALPLSGGRRRLRGLTLALIACAAMLGISGCGSDTQGKTNYDTPTGTYAVTLTATDGTTTHATTMSLVVIPGTGSRP